MNKKLMVFLAIAFVLIVVIVLGIRFVRSTRYVDEYRVLRDDSRIALYPMDEIAKHPDATSCWTVIRGGVYNLTLWIDEHPGGREAILSICGKDGTAAFEGKHGGNTGPEETLAGFKIGELGTN